MMFCADQGTIIYCVLVVQSVPCPGQTRYQQVLMQVMDFVLPINFRSPCLEEGAAIAFLGWPCSTCPHSHLRLRLHLQVP